MPARPEPRLRSELPGTNPFKTGAGVVLLRNGQRLEVHVPVDVLLYERRPASCDLLLFDLRNSMISQLLNYGVSVPARGGNLVTFTGSRVVTATGHRVFCVDERDSDESGAGYRDCDRPPTTTRGTVVTGKLTVDWAITLRRL